MKHLFFTFTLMAVFAALVPSTMSAHDFEVDGIYYNISGNNVSVTYCGSSFFNSTDYSGVVVIPDSVTYDGRTYPVTNIEYAAFAYCNKVTNIILPHSLTTIGNQAFRSCSGLLGMTIPSSVTKIGTWTFLDCNSLSSLAVESGNPVYDSRDNCNAIIKTADNSLIYACVNTVIPNSVTKIGDYAYHDACRDLTSIEIPEQITYIGRSAYCNLSKITSIVVPRAVTFIGEQAFGFCNNLASIVVESGNPVYDSRDNCNAIIETASNTLITGCYNTIIPSTVTRIGNQSFNGISKLTSIDIPDGVTYIGVYSFANTKLRTVVIPESVTEICDQAFYYCTTLTSANIPDGVPYIGSYAFYCCSNLTNISIGKSVRSVGYYAFGRCPKLTSIELPDEVTYIGDYAFLSDIALQSINLGNYITNIGQETFSYCRSLKQINIPNSVTSIDRKAFEECTALEEVTIGDAVTSIGYRAFNHCSALKKLKLGSAVSSIGNEAFYGCDSLVNVMCKATTVPEANNNTFYNCYNQAKLYIPAESVEAYQAHNEWGRFTHMIPFIGAGPGDANGDGMINIADVTSLIDMLLSGEELPAYYDVNGDGEVNINDITNIIDMLMSGGF